MMGTGWGWGWHMREWGGDVVVCLSPCQSLSKIGYHAAFMA